MIVNIKRLEDNPLRIQVNTDDTQYLKDLHKALSDFVPNYYHMPQFKRGGWDGKSSMFLKPNRSVPYGLLMDVIRYHKKHYPGHTLDIDPDVSGLFRGQLLNYKFDLSLCPYDYQQDCIDGAIRNTKGIIRSATASGKSLMIAYILKILNDFNISKRQIVIVPTTNLITQFVGDLIDYGIDQKDIGSVWQKAKQFDKPYVISTWHTLAKRKYVKYINLYNTIIIDETHQAGAFQIRKILGKATRAQYRLGFTGTLHAGDMENWNVKAYLGPVLKDYPSQLLAKWGYVAKCNVNVINLDYDDPYYEKYSGSYPDVRDDIFNNPYRMHVLTEIVKQVDSTILLLVGRVELEGVILKEIFKKANVDKEVVFISGKTSTDEEVEFWRQEAIKRRDLILVATYGKFQHGINIPPLKYLVMAAPFKSKIRVLQSIGRTLRKHVEKSDGAQIIDIADMCKYFDDHADKRMRLYYSERFYVKEVFLKMGDNFDLLSLFPRIYGSSS
jgi:superfamily II DNA or RNA helicase